jgi:hypothetical protein
VVTAERRTLSITAKLVDLLTQPLGRMQSRFVSFSRATVASLSGLVSKVFSLRTAVLGLVGGFVSLSTIKAFGDQADSLLKLAESTGDTVRNLSELQTAFDLAGLKADNFDEALKALTVQSTKAQQDVGGNLARSFAAVGISIEDLQRLAPAQLFEKIAAGLDRYGSAQQRASALARVLPGQFQQLLPILGKGLGDFQKQIEDVRKAGATITEQQARAAAALNDSLSKVGISIGGLARALIEQFGPQATVIFERLAEGITANRGLVVDLAKAIAGALVSAIRGAADAFIAFVDLFDNFASRPPEVERRISALREELNSLTAGQSVVSQLADGSGLRRQGELRAEIERLESITLSASLRETRDRIERELAASVAAVRASIDGSAPAALQEWTAQDIERFRQGLSGALQPGAVPNSAFQPAAAVPSLPSADDLADDTERAADATQRLREEAERLRLTPFQGNFWDGFNDGASAAIANFTSFEAAGQQAADTIIGGGLNGLSNAMADIITRTRSASEAFREFARGLLTDLARVISRMLIVRALSSIFGGTALAKGGVVQGDMGPPQRAFARGGVATGPTVALFGEGGQREAFVPLPDNRRIPVMLMGNGGGGQTFNFNITAMDGRDVQRVLIEQQATLGAIWRHQAEHQQGMRQVLQRAAR